MGGDNDEIEGFENGGVATQPSYKKTDYRVSKLEGGLEAIKKDVQKLYEL